MMSISLVDGLSILPWQQQQWKKLSASRQQQKCPHALLMHGPAGTGKAHFALLFAQTLFCDQPKQWGPCGECQHCRWFALGHHPDCTIVEPEAENKNIAIDRIRELVNSLQLKSHSLGPKVVIISPAERMLTAASNSLLKTLEEPPGDCVLILLSQQVGRLLPTIRSRCQNIRFPSERSEPVVAWLCSHTHKTEQEVKQCLALAQGAPLVAENYLQQDILGHRDQILADLLGLLSGQSDPLKLAAVWLKADLYQPLYWISGALLDLMRLQYSDEPPNLCHPDWRERMQPLAGKLSRIKVQGLGQELHRAIQMLQTSANSQMLMENIFIQFSKVSIKA